MQTLQQSVTLHILVIKQRIIRLVQTAENCIDMTILGEIVKAGEYGVWEASANDNTYAPPYYVKLGVRASSNASIEIHFDWIRAYKSADPASFTTPRIIEF